MIQRAENSMAEAPSRQSPLAHLDLGRRAVGNAGTVSVRFAEVPFRAQVNLRGNAEEDAFRAAAEAALGFALPRAPNTTATAGDRTALWLGPDEWLVVAPPGGKNEIACALRRALSSLSAAVTEVGETCTVISVSGPRARDVLAKGCTLDLHPREFGPGRCAQSTVDRIDVILHQTDKGPSYELYVQRSFAEHLWLWLEDAALEYGAGIGEG